MCQSKERNFSFQCPQGNTIIVQKFYGDGVEHSYKTNSEDDDDDDGWWSIVPQDIQTEINEKFKIEQLMPGIQEACVSQGVEHLHTPTTQRYYKIATPSTRIQTPRISETEDNVPTQQTTRLLPDKALILDRYSPENTDNAVSGNKTPSRNSEKIKSAASTPSTVLMNSSTSSKNRYSHSTPGSPLSHIHSEEELSPFMSISKLLDQRIGDSPGWLSSPTQRIHINSINNTQTSNPKSPSISTPFSKIRRFSLGGVSKQYPEHSPKSWSPLDTPSRVRPRRGLRELTVDDEDSSNTNTSNFIECLKDPEDSLKKENISQSNSIGDMNHSSQHSSNAKEHPEDMNTANSESLSRSPSIPTISQDSNTVELSLALPKASGRMGSSNLIELGNSEFPNAHIDESMQSTEDLVPVDDRDLESAEQSLSPSLFENTPNESEHSSNDCTDVLSEDVIQCEEEKNDSVGLVNSPHSSTTEVDPIDDIEETCKDVSLSSDTEELKSDIKIDSHCNGSLEEFQDNVDECSTTSGIKKDRMNITSLSDLNLDTTPITSTQIIPTQLESVQYDTKPTAELVERPTVIDRVSDLFEATTHMDLSILKSQGFRTGSGRVLPLPNENELREAENALLLNRPIKAKNFGHNMFRAKTLEALAQEAKNKHAPLTLRPETSDTEKHTNNNSATISTKRLNNNEEPNDLNADSSSSLLSKKPRLIDEPDSAIPETVTGDTSLRIDEKPDFNNIENTLLTFGGFSTGKGKKLQPPNKASLKKAIGLFETVASSPAISPYKTKDSPGFDKLAVEKASLENDTTSHASKNVQIDTPSKTKRPLADVDLFTSYKRMSLDGSHPLEHKKRSHTEKDLPNTNDNSKEAMLPLMGDLQDEFHDLDVTAIVNQFGGFTSGFRPGLRPSAIQQKGLNVPDSNRITSNLDCLANSSTSETLEQQNGVPSLTKNTTESSKQDQQHSGDSDHIIGNDNSSAMESAKNLYTCGFSTGAGRKLNPPSKDAMTKAASIFNDLEEKDISLSFSTGSGKKLAIPTKSSLEQAFQLFDDTNDTNNSIASNHHPGAMNNIGFSTGAGKKLPTPTKSSLEQAYKLFNDVNNTENLDIPSQHSGAMSNLGFSTGAGKKLASPTKASLEQAYKLFNDANDTENSDIPDQHADTMSSLGFSTGAGKKLATPAKSSLEQAHKLFNDVNSMENLDIPNQHAGAMSNLGFSTGAGKKLATPTKASLEQAYKLFNDANDTENLDTPNQHSSITSNIGFSTGTGKKLATPTKSSLEQAYKIFNDANDTDMLDTSNTSATSNLGFSTGTGKKLAAPSESSLQKVKELFNEDLFNDDLCLSKDILSEKPSPAQSEKKVTLPQPTLLKDNTETPADNRKMRTGTSPLSPCHSQYLPQQSLSERAVSTPQRQTFSVETSGIGNLESRTETKIPSAHPFRPTPNRMNIRPMFKTPIRKNANNNFIQDNNHSLRTTPIDKVEPRESSKTQFSTPKPIRGRLTKPFKSPMMSPRPQNPTSTPSIGHKPSRLSLEEPLRSSDIFDMRVTTPRISLKSFVHNSVNRNADQYRGCNPLVETESIDPSNAAQYRFKLSTVHSQLISPNDGWGFEDAHKELVALGCKSPQFSDRWTENHYRWIIWKIASYVKLCPEKFSSWWSPEKIMNQLRYRYEKEINLGHRSALKRIIERDDSPAKPMTLCVSAIFENNAYDKNSSSAETATDDTIPEISKYVLELTDGWYSLRTHVDKPLQRAIDSKKLRVGYKLFTVGARLVGSTEATPALEVSEATSLKITANSCRIASWDAKLGYSKQSVKVSLGAVSSEGGLIPCVDVIVMRKYPMCYMEIQSDGSKVFRNAKDEEAKERETQDKMAAEARLLFDKYAPNKSAATPKSLGKKKNINNIESGQELYGEMLNQVDPTGFLENLTSTQRTRLEQYMLQDKERQQSEIMQEINERLESSKQKRNVVPFFKIRVCDYPTFTHPSEASITIWRPDPSTYDMLLEGHRYKVYSLSASNKTISSFSLQKQIHLTATRTTSWKEMTISPEDKSRSLFFPREATGCDELDKLNRGQEVDIALMVLSVNCFSNTTSGRPQDISIFASDCSQKIIQINTNGKAGHLKANEIVGFVNLLYIRKDPVRNIHVLSVTQDTEIKPSTRIPHLRHIGLSIEDWIRKNPEHVKNLIASTEDIPEHGNVAHTDLLTQSPAPYALTPLTMTAKLPNVNAVHSSISPAHNTSSTPVFKRIPGVPREQSSHRSVTGSIVDITIVSEAPSQSADIVLCVDDGVQIWAVKSNRQTFKTIERLVDPCVPMDIDFEAFIIDLSLHPSHLQTFIEQFIRFKQEKVYPTLILNGAITIPKISTILTTANLVDPQSLYEQYQCWLKDQDVPYENTASLTDDVDYTHFFTILIDVTELDSNPSILTLPLLRQEWDHFVNLLIMCIRQITLQCNIRSSEDGWRLETIESIDPKQRTINLLKQLDHI